jgi:hypothetical protein
MRRYVHDFTAMPRMFLHALRDGQGMSGAKHEAQKCITISQPPLAADSLQQTGRDGLHRYQAEPATPGFA